MLSKSIQGEARVLGKEFGIEEDKDLLEIKNKIETNTKIRKSFMDTC